MSSPLGAGLAISHARPLPSLASGFSHSMVLGLAQPLVSKHSRVTFCPTSTPLDIIHPSCVCLGGSPSLRKRWVNLRASGSPRSFHSTSDSGGQLPPCERARSCASLVRCRPSGHRSWGLEHGRLDLRLDVCRPRHCSSIAPKPRPPSISEL